MSTDISHPNFPLGLDISPLALSIDEDTSTFDEETQKRAIERFGIAGRIWEAAELMIRYFRLSESLDRELDPPCSIIQRKEERPLTIVELGSGTGYVGLKLAEQVSRLGRKEDMVILTDLPDVCTLMEETLHDEEQKWMTSHLAASVIIPVKIFPLPWGGIAGANGLFSPSLLYDEKKATLRTLTHLVCSDLVYFPHLLAPLLRTLLQLTSPPFVRSNESPEVIISYKIRSLSKETAFWESFGLWFSFAPVFTRHPVHHAAQVSFAGTDEKKNQDGSWRILGSEGFVFVGHRRPESFDWVIPTDDNDLLAGVGARGSDMPNSDDTFESLMVMQMDV